MYPAFQSFIQQMLVELQLQAALGTEHDQHRHNSCPRGTDFLVAANYCDAGGEKAMGKGKAGGAADRVSGLHGGAAGRTQRQGQAPGSLPPAGRCGAVVTVGSQGCQMPPQLRH